MPKYFVFLMIEDSLLRKYLDLAIFALNPDEQWFAHVTVAGPFSRKIQLPRALDYHQQISILGAGRFDNPPRHTVYLNVSSVDLDDHMNKPDFKAAVPHLTLYNGADKLLADLLFLELQRRRLFAHFYTTSFRVVESRPQKQFDLAYSLDTSLLPRTRGMAVDAFRSLTVPDRVTIALEALEAGLTRRFYDRLAPAVG
jgi:hypothetical protein